MAYTVAETLRWIGFLAMCAATLPIFVLVTWALSANWPWTLCSICFLVAGWCVYWIGQTLAPYDGR